jgi:3'(2'), 5'-bisphosphate nucleotidase
LNPIDHDRVYTVFRDLALTAGAAILKVQARPDFESRLKSDDSPVTEADLAADALIRAGLADAFPDLPVVTEESGESHALRGERFVLVDPLDGTKEFLRRQGDFTVNIALIERGRPVRGVVFAPARGRLFQTAADGTSHEADLSGGGLRPLRVRVPDNAALVVVASKSHRDAATDAWIARYRVADSQSAGSSLKFCLVAAGEADLYPRLGRTMEWDTAAGQAVLEGAGGLVVRRDDGQPLTYGKPGWENPHFLALAPGVAIQPETAAG